MENKNDRLAHITSEEIMEFLLCNKLTPEFIEEADRINQHINQCMDCQKKYTHILSLKEKVEESINSSSKEESIKERVISKLFLLSEEMSQKGEDAKAYFADINDLVISASLKIRDYAELTVKNISGMGYFKHPRFSTALRSTNDSMQGAEKKSVVVDENLNRFLIERDGTLIVELSEYDYVPGTLLFLVSEDESVEPYYAVLKKSEEKPNMVEAEFEDILPGEYSVVVK